MAKIFTLLLTALIVTSCSNSKNQSTEEEVKDTNFQEEITELNSDTISVLNQKEELDSNNSLFEFIDIPLDSLLSFNSESELKKVFGDNVKRSLVIMSKGQLGISLKEWENTIIRYYFPTQRMKSNLFGEMIL